MRIYLSPADIVELRAGVFSALVTPDETLHPVPRRDGVFLIEVRQGVEVLVPGCDGVRCLSPVVVVQKLADEA